MNEDQIKKTKALTNHIAELADTMARKHVSEFAQLVGGLGLPLEVKIPFLCSYLKCIAGSVIGSVISGVHENDDLQRRVDAAGGSEEDKKEFMENLVVSPIAALILPLCMIRDRSNVEREIPQEEIEDTFRGIFTTLGLEEGLRYFDRHFKDFPQNKAKVKEVTEEEKQELINKAKDRALRHGVTH